MSDECISPLRRRMIEDMTVRKFMLKTQSDYIRVVKNFTIFLGRSPDRFEHAPQGVLLPDLHAPAFRRAWSAPVRGAPTAGRRRAPCAGLLSGNHLAADV